MSSQIPDYGANVRNMSNNTWRTAPGFKYDLNDGYNDLAMDLLDWIFPRYEDFTGFRLNEDDLLDFDSIEGNDIVWDNNGPVGYIAVGLVFTILMVLGGIAWCVIKFCCCCLRSGDDSDEESMVDGSESSKREKFARISCGVGLGFWILLLSFGLFGCFVANEQIHTAISDLPKDIDNSLYDADQYRNTAIEQIQSIFITSYNNFSYALETSIPDVSEDNAEMKKIISELNKALELASKLEHDFESFEIVFTESKDKIVKLFKTCNTEFCEAVVQDGLKTFTMSSSYETLKSLMNVKISDTITDGIRSASINVPDIIRQWIDDTRIKLSANAGQLTAAMEAIPINGIRDDIKKVDEEMQDWVSVLYYIVLFACIFLLAIPVVLLVGTIFGCVGSRSRRTLFNRRRGGTFMNCGLFAIFLTAWIFWIAAIAAFTFSGVLSQIVCEAVRDLENGNSSTTDSPATQMAHMDDIRFKFGGGLNLNRARAEGDYKLPNYGQIVRTCKKGASAYDTFNLKTAFDVSEVLDLTLPPIPNPFIDKYIKLNENLVKVSEDLKKIEKHIEKTTEPNVMNLPELREMAEEQGAREIQKELEVEIKKLEDSQGHLSASIQNGVKSLGQTIQGVSSAAKQLVESQKFENIMAEADPNEHVSIYTQFIYDQVTENVGTCEPLWTALDTTIELFCYKIAAPVSAFWFSLTVILLLFFPIIITAILLEKLYRRK